MRLVMALITLSVCSIGSAFAVDYQNPYVVPAIPTNSAPDAGRPFKPSPRFYIGLIIDDMGYRYQSGKRAINLPANITYSFLPYSPHALKLANLANSQHKEIMLHIPMEASNGKALGPGGLTTEMPKAIFDLELTHNLSSIPYIKGVNNHMGSLLTEQSEQMTWLMEKLVERDIYFVDSRTSGKSLALKKARQFGISSETRDIFVDHDLSEKVMRQQLQQAISVAKRNGSAVVIAHPFPETMNVLEKWLPEAKAQGLEFVYMSDLVNIRSEYRAQHSEQKRLTQWQTKQLKQQVKNN